MALAAARGDHREEATCLTHSTHTLKLTLRAIKTVEAGSYSVSD